MNKPFARIFALILGLLTLSECSKHACSAEKTKEIIKNINLFLKEKLNIQENFFTSDLLDVTENGQILIKNNHSPAELAQRFVMFRAKSIEEGEETEEEKQEKKEKYLERFSEKLPSTASILETSAKLTYKKQPVPPCSFVGVIFEQKSKGQKIISLF